LYYNTAAADSYVTISPRAIIERTSSIYYNICGYRLRYGVLTATGTTLDKTTVPKFCNSVNIYGNQAPMAIYVEYMNIATEPVTYSGQALLNYGLRFAYNQSARCFINNASLWINMTNSAAASVTAPVVGLLVETNPNFILGGNHATGDLSADQPAAIATPVIETTAATNKFGCRFSNCTDLIIKGLPGGMSSMVMNGEISGVVRKAVALGTNIYKTNPQVGTVTSIVQGVGDDVNLIHGHVFVT
jgi:hypothetical protein